MKPLHLASIISVLSIFPICSMAQDLQITQPANGQVFHPGDTISVLISNPNPAKHAQVAVFGQPPLNATATQTGQLSMAFQLLVPPDARSGRYSIYALSKANGTLDGQMGSAPVEIVVRSNKGFDSLYVDSDQLYFPYPGLSLPILVYGVVSGKKTTLKAEDGLKLDADDPSVVSIGPGLIVKALKPGSTQIRVTAGNITPVMLPISVGSQNVRGDFDDDGDVDTNDVAQLQRSFGPTTTPSDARDLNGDGRIDALDLRILTTICTRLRCSLQ